MRYLLILFSMLLFMLLCWQVIGRSEVDVNILADAIGKAENSWEYKPYGVLKPYCKPHDPNGQCRKGCIQTITKWKNKLAYTGEEDFIKKFAEIYAPSKAHSLNRHWPKTVLYWYTHLKK